MPLCEEVFVMWNVIGPLVGVVIGALLTPWISWRWQHRQWVMDNKKQEYRDLLDGLIQASDEIIRARPTAPFVMFDQGAFSFTPPQLLQATAASYNFGVGNISGNPNTIDVGTTGGNYGSTVVGMMACFSHH
jgi:hypothetical protein